ncbi:dihydrodipicolinate synthase/N-acetylneuraminate lyase [Haloactinopolyspora alba]|uniref:Dihydrodipicolinate synthase/N-acetylneuraminate lyase n=1 Tax=Haloactinopolyspora alba TaxID=648780 RepID=A0A2P8DZ00_9ACTN|nr:dihydrodipicolinate synthase family protein [Haloactinopolyspora alba]PSL02407.1 dihydrodipicolinate synthase/N-acetylneuraminate lyase [Haloactinopolyspora alba]
MALDASTLGGTWATVLLPVREDDSIDDARLRDSLDVLIASGVDGVYTNGTAGEFHTLDEDECAHVQRVVAARCRAAGMPFQLGACHPCAGTQLSRLRDAVSLAPDAVQVILPDWLPLADDEVERSMAAMAEAAGDVPLVLYAPPHAKTPVRPELLGLLSRRFPGLIGAKTAGGDDEWYRRIAEHPPDVAVFVPGHDLASGRIRGAAGSFSNIACLSPRGAVRWWQQMHDDPPAALDVERRIHALQAERVAPLQAAGFSNPALDKALAAAGGWADIGARTRWPHSWVDDATVTRIGAAARDRVPELFR